MFIIKKPKGYDAERDYTIEYVFQNVLQIPFKSVTHGDLNWEITNDACKDKKVIVSDALFQIGNDDWLKDQSLPKTPLEIADLHDYPGNVNLCKPEIPVIYGKKKENGKWLDIGIDHAEITIDIFGSIFFMLTRYEEVVKKSRDAHGRFPARFSLAYLENFLDRPIVNEYTEILWAVMKRLWPVLRRRQREFRILPTHDVDCPFDPSLNNPRFIARTIGGDLIKRKSLKQGLKHAADVVNFKLGRRKDPFDTFDWIMQQSENLDLKSAFFFKAAKRSKYDKRYSLYSTRTRELIGRTHSRGHEIGFHPGYYTASDQKIWNRELSLLRDSLPEGIKITKGRQHYLRFEVPYTWRYWADSDLETDSTMAFADFAGFRCGTCIPFYVFDVKSKEKLNLLEQPLIVMERSILNQHYMGISSYEEALDFMLKLKNRCRMFNGDFVLLWHNTTLVREEDRRLYQQTLIN